MRYWLLASTLLLSLSALAAENKKTVCAATINSSEEIELFKTHFDQKLWNFVELTDFSDKDGDDHGWLKNSCSKKIQCDILVISGHFGGSFFGESGKTLPLTELEANSCNSDCDGILQRPKEVFLFGCNTLAGKNRDHRSPQEYIRVLMSDGFSLAQAQQIAAFRYSPLGDSFAGRMTQVFSKTPRIYGFTSVGPSGKKVEPLLNRYLLSAKEDYRDFDKMNQSLGSEPNTRLLSALKDTAIAQEKGTQLLSGNTNDKPYCYLSNEQINRIQKIKYIRDVFESGRSITLIPYIQSFIHKLKSQSMNLSTEEKFELEHLKSNPKIMDDFKRLLSLKEDIYTSIRLGVWSMMKDLLVISDVEYQKSFFNVANLNFSKPLDIATVDTICSGDYQINIDPHIIPPARWNEGLTYNLIKCLKPESVEFKAQFLKTLSMKLNSNIFDYVLMAAKGLNLSDSKSIETLTSVAQNSPNYFAKATALSLLIQLDPDNSNIPKFLIAGVQSESDIHRKSAYLRMFRDLKNLDENTLQYLTRFLVDRPVFETRYAAFSALEGKDIQDSVILNQLVDGIERNIESASQLNQILSKIEIKDERVVQRLVGIMRNSKISKVSMNGLASLGKTLSVRKDLQRLFLEMFATDPREDIGGNAGMMLANIQNLGVEFQDTLTQVAEKNVNTLKGHRALSILSSAFESISEKNSIVLINLVAKIEDEFRRDTAYSLIFKSYEHSVEARLALARGLLTDSFASNREDIARTFKRKKRQNDVVKFLNENLNQAKDRKLVEDLLRTWK